MARRRYSERAKRGTRYGLFLRRDRIKANIETIKGEIKLYKKYRGKGLNDGFINRVLRALDKKIAKRKSQLKEYEVRIADYKKRGLI